MNYTVPITIRFFDIDMHQHVNNSVYFTYMENARTDLLKDEFVKYHENGIAFIVAESFCKYRKPILLTDKINCELSFELTGALHFTITYLFRNAETGQLHAEGKTKMAMLDEMRQRPIPIPEELIEKHMV